MTAVHHGTALHRADLGAAGREVLHDLHADFAMGDLAATETDGHLHLIATLKELLRHFRLRENVVLLDGGGQLNLLGFDDPLILPVFAFAPRLFVAVLVIVQQFADRRFCRGLDFGEVEAALFRQLHRLGCWHDAELFAVFVNQADFPVADFLIDHQIECYVHTPPNFR